MIVFLVGLLGLVFGSFLNVCIYRIPRGESVVFPSSHCTVCNTKLKWYDLIPVLSFLLLKGKCRYCKNPISITYPIIEIICAVISILSVNLYGLSISALLIFIIGCLLLYVSVVDIKTYEIDLICLLFIGFLKLLFIFSEKGFSKAVLISVLCGPIFNSILNGVIFLVSREKAMGLGDVILLMAGGIGFSVKEAIVCNFIAYILGFIYIIFSKIFQVFIKKQMQDRNIPFGPFISMGVFITTIAGERLIDIYINFMGVI